MVETKLAFIGREYNPVWDSDKREVKEYNLNLKQPPLYLDFNKKKHTAVFSKSGGGKSYLLRVLAEEAQRTIGNYAVVMIDPMGIFSTLLKPNTNKTELDAWNKFAPEKVQPEAMKNFKVWVPAGDKNNFTKNMYHEVFSLKASELSSETLCFVFDLKYLGPQANLYRKACRKVAKQNGDYALSELIEYIRMHAEEDLHFKSNVIDALVMKLDALEELGIITPDGISLDRMIREGQVTVFDLSMSSAYTARLLVHFLAEKCLPIRVRIKKMVDQAQVDETLIDKPAWYIPPMQFIVDEARAYLPGSPALCECLVKGRNCGLLVTAVSQSLNLDEDLYANLTHLFIGPLNFEADISAVRKMVPFAKSPAEFRNAIKELQTGCFMYFNTDTKLEKRIRIRPSHTLHPASSELLDERKYFKGANFTPLPASPPETKQASAPVPAPAVTSRVGPAAHIIKPTLATPSVVDIHRINGTRPPFDVYIGRATQGTEFNMDSKWANPYKPQNYQNPKDCLVAYENYIRAKIKTDPKRYDLKELWGKRLGCWCLTDTQFPPTTFSCHGQILMKIIAEMAG